MTKKECRQIRKEGEARGLQFTGLLAYARDDHAVNFRDLKTGIPVTIQSMRQWMERCDLEDEHTEGRG